MENLQNIYNFPHHTNFKWHFTNFSRNWIRSCILPFIIFVWQKSYALKSKVWFSREKKYFWVKLNGHAAFLHIWFWSEREQFFDANVILLARNHFFWLYLFKKWKINEFYFYYCCQVDKTMHAKLNSLHRLWIEAMRGTVSQLKCALGRSDMVWKFQNFSIQTLGQQKRFGKLE